MKVVELRDGRFVRIRKLVKEDNKDLQRFNSKLSERSRYDFMPHPYDDTIIEKIVARNERGDDISLIAEYEGEVIGYFFLWYAKQRVALLGIGIADNFQGLGLGRKVMELLIEIGRNEGLEGIELSTTIDNDRAYALYEKVGFRFVKNVETILGDGSVRIERCMFLPFKKDAQHMNEPHTCPV